MAFAVTANLTELSKRSQRMKKDPEVMRAYLQYMKWLKSKEKTPRKKKETVK